MPKRKHPAPTKDFKAFHDLAQRMVQLNKDAYRACKPVVEDLIRTNSRDVHAIEHTLDSLLDFCGYEPVLLLYRKLCRHYYDIDPATTAFYVNSYREMWGSE